MKIKPIGNRVLLKPVEKKSRTESGIYIPSSGDDFDNLGRIIEVGGDVTKVSLGDTVVYSKFSSTEVSDSTKKLLIVEEKEILAIVRGSDWTPEQE